MTSLLPRRREGGWDGQDPGSPGLPPGAFGGRRGRLVGVAAAVVVVVAVLVWVVAFSPLLGVRTVTVRGADSAVAAQIRAAAAVPNGTPLIRLPAGAVRDRVAALPGVADVRVSVSYPSTVVISVRQRSAVGYLRSGSGFLLVDSSGLQFQTVAVAPSALPRFDVPDGSGGRAAGQAAAAVAGALPAAVLAQLADIVASSVANVTLNLRDGRTVVWGSAQVAAVNSTKAGVLVTLLAQPGKTFDLSTPGLAVAR